MASLQHRRRRVYPKHSASQRVEYPMRHRRIHGLQHECCAAGPRRIGRGGAATRQRGDGGGWGGALTHARTHVCTSAQPHQPARALSFSRAPEYSGVLPSGGKLWGPSVPTLCHHHVARMAFWNPASVFNPAACTRLTGHQETKVRWPAGHMHMVSGLMRAPGQWHASIAARPPPMCCTCSGPNLFYSLHAP